MLLNQNKASGGRNPPATLADEPRTIPTYGYDIATGEAVLFQLKDGEKLPAAFVDSPAKVKPAKGK